MQPPKTAQQIENMRIAGKILAGIFADLRQQVKPGVSQIFLDKWVEHQIKKRGAVVTYKTPEINFPGAICISVNDEVVHGIPTKQFLEVGDVAKFDLVITYKGMNVDSAFTMVVGEEPKGAKKHLLSSTERALSAGIAQVKGTFHTGDIGAAVEEVLKKARLGIVRDLAGHGIGEAVHVEPDIPNFGTRGQGQLVRPGDTICIEPMVTLGSGDVVQDDDGWTFRTRDGSLSAHMEHTVLVLEDSCEILTQL
ncbi:MAG: type I methionyl aminopeptidase [Candidatus Nomurabacteria bacterium]|jgi:methionyl aminopeptidase|nr:type I methionyl aminopeptidase [Candidatus Nomurabacteria bacterium]